MANKYFRGMPKEAYQKFNAAPSNPSGVLIYHREDKKPVPAPADRSGLLKNHTLDGVLE